MHVLNVFKYVSVHICNFHHTNILDKFICMHAYDGKGFRQPGSSDLEGKGPTDEDCCHCNMLLPPTKMMVAESEHFQDHISFLHLGRCGNGRKGTPWQEA